ncbi:MAG TPA: hypothetical protein PLD49_01950 [Thermoclostridium caenicola]|nr:hypothetical protein [Thermoclostridium caenicola]HOK42416.1 hypothetical protein [Thermoclostridium caenicola]HOL84816.1 hypothetical protein [Thermoclostridium caenicola]HOP72294.1 hypothetical protein [Thermoclostridium caenicola]
MVSGGYMDFLMKFMAIAMLLLLIAVQLAHLSPYGERFRTDQLNGVPIGAYQSVIGKGYATLNLLGEYAANSASLYINGLHVMVIDKFPVRLELNDGDVVEIHAAPHTHAFYVYLSDKSSGLYTDMKEKTVKVSPGMNRILQAHVRD